MTKAPTLKEAVSNAIFTETDNDFSVSSPSVLAVPSEVEQSVSHVKETLDFLFGEGPVVHAEIV